MVEGGEGRGGGKARRVEGEDGALAVGGLGWGPGWAPAGRVESGVEWREREWKGRGALALTVGGHLGQGHNLGIGHSSTPTLDLRGGALGSGPVGGLGWGELGTATVAMMAMGGRERE